MLGAWQAFTLVANPMAAPPPDAATPPAALQAREAFIRLWSNATQWPQQALPAQGDNVTIWPSWSVLLDVDPPALGNLTVQGALTFSPSRCAEQTPP